MRAETVFLLKVCLREIKGGGGAVVSVSRKSRLCRCEARLCNLPPPVSAALLRLAFADRRRRREALIYPGSLGEASSPSYLLLLLHLLLFLAFVASSHSHPARFCSCAFAFMPLTSLSPSLSPVRSTV